MGYVLFGVALALVVVLVIYFNPPAPPQRVVRHRRNEDEDEDEFEGTRETILRRNFTEQRTRRSLPGDKCAVCLEEMEHGDMKYTKCGHAMDGACFEVYRYIRRNCPLCDKPINLSLPGDNCAICLESLSMANMAHLRCQHALHFECHQQFIESGAKCCPLCREKV
ncbi:E3 ubiquitin-protein ligase MIEL1 [Drosophila subpulchrella]|uniref:E3 ubiquitin-protein ligase MIEL1 n=1 Tax=Drosophila subpulchrella TaxID=1486046 RepID=UPI0018A156D9|nr:E3 ubiquitin-protein ligase MIEL1 [Drosophila subpulchrella]